MPLTYIKPFAILPGSRYIFNMNSLVLKNAIGIRTNLLHVLLNDGMLEMSGIELQVRMYKLYKLEDNYNESPNRKCNPIV